MDWLAMAPEDFTTTPAATPLALFAEPDPSGTPDLFTE